MKKPKFPSIIAFSGVLGLSLCSGNTQADPLTPTAKVKVTTLVRPDSSPPKVIKLAANDVFLFKGFSTRPGDSLDITFTKGGESFPLDRSTFVSDALVLPFANGIPLKGPATVTISGKGLVSYEIQKL